MEYAHPVNGNLVSNDKLMQITMKLWPSKSTLHSVEDIAEQLQSIKDNTHSNGHHCLVETLNKLAYNLKRSRTRAEDVHYLNNANDAIKRMLPAGEELVSDEQEDVILNLRLLGLVQAIREGVNEVVLKFIQDLYAGSLQMYSIDLNKDFIKAAWQQTEVLGDDQDIMEYSVCKQFLLEKHLYYLAARYGYRLSSNLDATPKSNPDEDVLGKFYRRLAFMGFNTSSIQQKIRRINSCAVRFAVYNGHFKWVSMLYNNLDHLNYMSHGACPVSALLTESNCLYAALREDNAAMVSAIAAIVNRKNELPQRCHPQIEFLERQLDETPHQLFVRPKRQQALSQPMRSAISQFEQAQLINCDSSIYRIQWSPPNKIQFIQKALVNASLSFLYHYVTHADLTLKNNDINQVILGLYNHEGEAMLIRRMPVIIDVLPHIASERFYLNDFNARISLRALIRHYSNTNMLRLWDYIDINSLVESGNAISLLKDSLALLQEDHPKEQYLSKVDNFSDLLFRLSYFIWHNSIIELFQKAIVDEQNSAAIVGLLQNYCQRVYPPNQINRLAKRYRLNNPIHEANYKVPAGTLLESDSFENSTQQRLRSLSPFLGELKHLMEELYSLVNTNNKQLKFEIYALLHEVSQYIILKPSLTVVNQAYDQAIQQLQTICPPDNSWMFRDELPDYVHKKILPVLKEHQLDVALSQSDEELVKSLTNQLLQHATWPMRRRLIYEVARWCFQNNQDKPEGLNLFHKDTIANFEINNLFAIWDLEAKHNRTWFSALAFKYYDFGHNEARQSYLFSEQPFNQLIETASESNHAMFVFHLMEMLSNQPQTNTILREQYHYQISRESLLATDDDLYKAIKRGEVNKVGCLASLMNICIDSSGEIYEPFKPLLSDIYELIQNQPHKYIFAALVSDQKNGDSANTMLSLVAQFPLPMPIETQDIEKLSLQEPVIQKLSRLIQGEASHDASLANDYGVSLINQALIADDKDLVGDLLQWVKSDNNSLNFIQEAIHDNHDPALVAQLLKWANFDEEQFKITFNQLMGSQYKPEHSGFLLSLLLRRQSCGVLSVNLQWYAARFAIQNNLHELLLHVLYQVNDNFDSSQLIDLLNEAQKQNNYNNMALLLWHSEQYRVTPRCELMHYALENDYTDMLEFMVRYFEKSLTRHDKSDISRQASNHGLSISWPPYRQYLTSRDSWMGLQQNQDINQESKGNRGEQTFGECIKPT